MIESDACVSLGGSSATVDGDEAQEPPSGEQDGDKDVEADLREILCSCLLIGAHMGFVSSGLASWIPIRRRPRA